MRISHMNQAIVPHQFSVTNAPFGFQGQVASSSNYQGQRRQPYFEESV